MIAPIRQARAVREQHEDKDYQALNAQWARGDAPWKLWKDTDRTW